MRLSLAMIVLGLAGVVGGALLIGMWAVGLAVIADSVALVVFGLIRDVPERPADDLVRRRAA